MIIIFIITRAYSDDPLQDKNSWHLTVEKKEIAGTQARLFFNKKQIILEP